MKSRFTLTRLRKAIVTVLLIPTLLLTGTPGAQANNHRFFPSSEKVIYALDISGSSDVRELWFLLRNSIENKLPSAMGVPVRDGLRPRLPSDVTVTVINNNSYLATSVEILSYSDAERMWAFMIDTVGGGNPSEARMKPIFADFFGGNGAFPILVDEFILDEAPVATKEKCEKRALSIFEQGQFMKNVPPNLKKQGSVEVCKVILKAQLGLEKADQLLLQGTSCGKMCSDVVGVIKKAAAAARDLGNGGKLCLAIASDMLNNSKSVPPGSVWLTLPTIKKAPSEEEAKAAGETVARQSGIFFPSRVKVRVEIIGQGGNMDPSLSSKLNAFWAGFFDKVGIKNRGLTDSLDKACQTKGN